MQKRARRGWELKQGHAITIMVASQHCSIFGKTTNLAKKQQKLLNCV